MRVIALIDDPPVVQRILEHLAHQSARWARNPLPAATGVASRPIPRAHNALYTAQGSSPNRAAHPHPAGHGE